MKAPRRELRLLPHGVSLMWGGGGGGNILKVFSAALRHRLDFPALAQGLFGLYRFLGVILG